MFVNYLIIHIFNENKFSDVFYFNQFLLSLIIFCLPRLLSFAMKPSLPDALLC